MSEEPAPAGKQSLADGFDASLAQFAKISHFLSGDAAAGFEHFELETYIKTEGFELLRLLLQDHFDLRALGEVRLRDVNDAGGLAHRALEANHERPLTTIVGTVRVGRMAYRHRGAQNLYPADAVLNLPQELHSHGLRELAAIESSRGSFEEAKEAMRRGSGVKVGHRQVEELASATAVDFAAFYDHQPRPTASNDEVVVISADGKGVAMRPEDLNFSKQGSDTRVGQPSSRTGMHVRRGGSSSRRSALRSRAHARSGHSPNRTRRTGPGTLRRDRHRAGGPYGTT